MCEKKDTNTGFRMKTSSKHIAKSFAYLADATKTKIWQISEGALI